MVRELEKGLTIGPETTNEGPNETINTIEEDNEPQHSVGEEKDKEAEKREKRKTKSNTPIRKAETELYIKSLEKK